MYQSFINQIDAVHRITNSHYKRKQRRSELIIKHTCPGVIGPEFTISNLPTNQLNPKLNNKHKTNKTHKLKQSKLQKIYKNQSDQSSEESTQFK